MDDGMKQLSGRSTSFPRERKESWKFEQESPGPTGTAVSGEAEIMAAAWEEEKLAKIERQYNETMETIAGWESDKKAFFLEKKKEEKDKARRQKGDSEWQRAKELEEYNYEMRRIRKVAAASRLTAEEKRRNAEGKVKEKAGKIRATGKLPQSPLGSIPSRVAASETVLLEDDLSPAVTKRPGQI